MRRSVLVASSVMPSRLLKSMIALVSGPVAPRAAASVSSFTCSGVRPKLQVIVLPLALPALAMAHEPAST